jgi:hypothetical protein
MRRFLPGLKAGSPRRDHDEGRKLTMKDALAPRTTPPGKAIERGPEFSTVQEMLSLIGAGQGMFPVPVHATFYDTRPDIVYVPISDGVPRKSVLIWRAAGETNRIRAFIQTAQEFVANGYPSAPDPAALDRRTPLCKAYRSWTLTKLPTDGPCWGIRPGAPSSNAWPNGLVRLVNLPTSYRSAGQRCPSI